MAPSYAADLKLITDVSGGVPADVRNVAESLDGIATGEGLLLYALIGLQQAYPGQFPLDDSLSAAGKATEASLKTQCVVQTLAGYPFKKFSEPLTRRARRFSSSTHNPLSPPFWGSPRGGSEDAAAAAGQLPTELAVGVAAGEDGGETRAGCLRGLGTGEDRWFGHR
ncbi:lipase family protein [Streptomyces canus]|uniref:lipase family protein n=1 Tax=Streptomyces canus TaxID=58343 RepID=UPI0036F1558C